MNLQKVTENDFNAQLQNKFSFNDEGKLNFLYCFSDLIASIYVEDEKLAISSPIQWEFLKSPNGFIFASPILPPDYKVEYVSKLNHSQEMVLPFIIGYASSLIWLSHISFNAFQENDVIANNAIVKAHRNGMDGLNLELFSKEQLGSLNRILD